jgi:hypothetical protein
VEASVFSWKWPVDFLPVVVVVWMARGALGLSERSMAATQGEVAFRLALRVLAQTKFFLLSSFVPLFLFLVTFLDMVVFLSHTLFYNNNTTYLPTMTPSKIVIPLFLS